ncbi:MAG: BrnA antitoxin family protein [Anaerolineales bacterium]|jgi:uncharacterized protein (DUF4415 family)|nr:BrnA antitoxin family protein [Anaerolineales bacterium]
MKAEYDFSKAKRGAVIPLPPGKERITIRLDADILDWFRQQANAQGGGNYQTMINQVLREYIMGHQAPLEELLRRVVREELAQYKAD